MRTLRGVGRLTYQAKDVGETDYVIHVNDQGVGFGVKSARGELTGNPKANMTIATGSTEVELRLSSGQVIKIILTNTNLDRAVFQVNGELPA